jgi:leucyl aminopeptidase
MHLPQPQLHNFGELTDNDLEKFDVISIPAWSGVEAPHIPHETLIDRVLDLCKIDRDDLRKLYPEFSGKAKEIVRVPVQGRKKLIRVLLVGVGGGSREDFRKAGASLGRNILGSGYRLLNAVNFTSNDEAIAHIMALSLSQYGWNLKSKDAADKKKRAKGSTSIWFAPEYSEQVARASLLANAVWQTRDLIHTPSNIKTPEWMGDEAKRLVREANSAHSTNSALLSVTIKKGNQLKEFGGLIAVGNSSPEAGPRLIEVRYAPVGSEKWPHVVLVGKGITFDTGGISLKRPYDLMIPMKSDMAGAAAVLTATLAMAQIQPRVRVTALLMCAQNMISGTAQRPSDVITQYGGTTVEIINTDAEGRLVLADGLALAHRKLEPDYLVDVATLTGSASIGLGKQYAAMYSRNPSLAATLAEIGDRIGDRVWHMPLVDDYATSLASNIADLNHDASAKKFQGGSITAALFLENFVGDRNWVHLDIAGPARSDSDTGEVIKGGTGFGTRLLIEWLASLS